MKKKIKEEARFNLIDPLDKWELELDNYVKETGSGMAGLFVEATNEKEALKYFKNLIKIIKEKEVKIES